MKTRIFNLIILDESGSMSLIKNEAITGVNETIQTISAAQDENENQEHFVTLVTFNNNHKTVYDRLPVKEVSEINDKTYVPSRCTALYDAMGMALTELKSCVADNDKVLVTIVTDGMENSSTEFDGMMVRKIVEELKHKGWIFTYIGANHNVEEVAFSLSIGNVMRFETTAEETKSMFNEERRCRSRLYGCVCNDDFDADDANKSFFRK